MYCEKRTYMFYFCITCSLLGDACVSNVMNRLLGCLVKKKKKSHLDKNMQYRTQLEMKRPTASHVTTSVRGHLLIQVWQKTTKSAVSARSSKVGDLLKNTGVTIVSGGKVVGPGKRALANAELVHQVSTNNTVYYVLSALEISPPSWSCRAVFHV